jgi:hypothetical protein
VASILSHNAVLIDSLSLSLKLGGGTLLSASSSEEAR